MERHTANGWNVAAFVLYVLLIATAFVSFTMAALAFGMSTDACHDAACDASYHEEAAILTVLIGNGLVLAATLALMIRGVMRGKVVFAWPLAGLLGLGVVLAIGVGVVH